MFEHCGLGEGVGAGVGVTAGVATAVAVGDAVAVASGVGVATSVEVGLAVAGIDAGGAVVGSGLPRYVGVGPVIPMEGESAGVALGDGVSGRAVAVGTFEAAGLR